MFGSISVVIEGFSFVEMAVTGLLGFRERRIHGQTDSNEAKECMGINSLADRETLNAPELDQLAKRLESTVANHIVQQIQ
jgi:hypothetical protein